MRTFPSRLPTLVLLCLVIFAAWPAKIVLCQRAPAGTQDRQADLYLWLSDRGRAYLGVRSDVPLPDVGALRGALEQAVGGPVTPVAPDDREFRPPDDDWLLVADFSPSLHRRGGLLQGQADPTTLLPLLRRQGVGWLTVSVMARSVPVVAVSGVRLLPRRGRRYVYGYRDYRTDRAVRRPVRFSYGYAPRNVLRLFLPLAFLLLLPVGVTLWMRGRALRAAPSVDPATVWFGYGRFLQWLTLSPWLVWVPTVLALHVDDFFGFLLGGTRLAHSGLSYAFWYLPSPVIVWCFALSHPVYAQVRGLDYTRRDLVRQAAWGQARLLPLLCLLMGVTESFTNLRAGVLWLAAALFAWIVATRGAVKAMGTAPHALTVGELRDRVFALAAKAGVRVQQVYVMPAGKGRMANAFAAVGNNVILTDFLLERMTRREVDAIIAHELTHLRRRHPALLSLMYLPLWLGAGALAGWVASRASPGAAVGAGLAAVLLGLLPAYFVSRRFEYTADAGALALTGDPCACITGLTRLSRLNRMPLEWGRHHARWLTHPTTLRRVDAIARQGGVSLPELQGLLTEASPDAGDDRYPLPTALINEETVFSTAAKLGYRQRLSWLLIGVATLTPALCALFAADHLSGIAIWAVEALGLLITVLLSHALTDRVQKRWFAMLERRLRAKWFSAESGLDASGVFMTLAPAARPCLYEGFFDWDIGLLFLSGGRLRYVGEQARFDLSAGAVAAVEARADTPGWRPWPRVYVTWPGNGLGEHTFSLRPGSSGTRKQSEEAARALVARIEAWRKSPVEGADTPDGAPPPTEESVTGADPRIPASPRALLGALLFQGVIASGVAVLCGLPFDGRASGGGAWYVIATAGIMTTLSFVPFWRLPRRAG